MSFGDSKSSGVAPSVPVAVVDCPIAEVGPSSSPACATAQSMEVLAGEYHRRTLALATAAHELKTPLSVCVGYIHLLASGKLGALLPPQRQALEEMDANVRRLQHFIGDFLTYASLETNAVHLRLQTADLEPCVREICEIWQPRFQAKGQSFELSLASGVAPCDFDYAKLQHALSNLLHNAWKFTPEQGSVAVMVEPYFWERRNQQDRLPHADRRTDPSRTPNSVCITVADNGPGVEPEFQLEIFEDFARGDTQETDGMGLGLSIARRIVQGHHGKIWIDSQPGKGSKFRLLLPLAQPSDGSHEAP
jgi:signal transduction histidine kinase